jgi:hypothetical protein
MKNCIYLIGAYFCLLTGVLSGCIQNTPAEYNDILVSYKEKGDEDFASMSKFLNIAIQEKEYSSSTITYLTNSAIDSLNARIESLKRLNVPPSTKRFKYATIDYLLSLINTSKTYRAYIILSDSLVTVQQIDSIRSLIRAAEWQTDSTLNVLISVQNDFAREKNIKL